MINVTQYNKRYILSTSEEVEIFALSNRGLDKLYNDTQFQKIEMRLLKIQLLQSLYFCLFSLLFCTLFCSLSHNVPFVVLGYKWSTLFSSYSRLYHYIKHFGLNWNPVSKWNVRNTPKSGLLPSLDRIMNRQHNYTDSSEHKSVLCQPHRQMAQHF